MLKVYLSKCQSSSISAVADRVHAYVDGETTFFLCSSYSYIVIVITPTGESILKCDLLSYSYKSSKG